LVRVRVETEVRPTEDPKKVLRALKKLFNMEFQFVERGEGWGSWVGESHSLDALVPLRAAIKAKRVDDTFYYYLRRLARGSNNLLVFKLNKQAAFVGVPSFAEEDIESPMGAITVEIEAPDLKKVIAWLAGRRVEDPEGHGEDKAV